MLIDEEDYKLSKSFNDLQESLDKTSLQIRNNVKKIYSDTEEAKLIIKNNASVLNVHYNHVPFYMRHELILNDLLKKFPAACPKELTSYLTRNAFFTPTNCAIIYSVISIVSFSLINIFALSGQSLTMTAGILTAEVFFSLALFQSLFLLTTILSSKEEADENE